MFFTNAGTNQECSTIVVVEFCGLGSSRPQDESSVAFASSIGATHAPSSCGKAKRWSAPPCRSQNGNCARIQLSASR